MDFSNRNAQAQPAANAAPAAAKRSSGKNDNNKLGRIGFIAAIAAVVVLVVALAVVAATSSKEDTSEAGLVDTSKLQAVFLNTGQVYFGNIDTLNSKYFVVTNIYYLQTANSGGTGAAAQNANTSVSLVKLGCELHEPFDKMVINRDQVTFWENLQDGGQVATAVKTFEKQNPNGQKCADQSSSASTNSVNNTQNAGSGNGNASGTNNTTTNP